jgi:hypothetical protein
MFYLTFSNYSFIVNIDLFKDLSVPNVQSFKVIFFKQLIMQRIVFKESYFFIKVLYAKNYLKQFGISEKPG